MSIETIAANTSKMVELLTEMNRNVQQGVAVRSVPSAGAVQQWSDTASETRAESLGILRALIERYGEEEGHRRFTAGENLP